MDVAIRFRNVTALQTEPTGPITQVPAQRRALVYANPDSTCISPIRRPFFFPILPRFRIEAADFANFLQGFHTGSDLKISAKGFVGSGTVKGEGKAVSLTADELKMDLHIKSPLGNSDLNVDLRKEGQSYRLHSPQNWPANVTQQGNTLTVENQTNPAQRLVIILAAPGAVDVKTYGFGYDGKTLVGKALN